MWEREKETTWRATRILLFLLLLHRLKYSLCLLEIITCLKWILIFGFTKHNHYRHQAIVVLQFTPIFQPYMLGKIKFNSCLPISLFSQANSLHHFRWLSSRCLTLFCCHISRAELYLQFEWGVSKRGGAEFEVVYGQAEPVQVLLCTSIIISVPAQVGHLWDGSWLWGTV